MKMLPVLGHEDLADLRVDVREIRETVASALIALGDPGTECPRKLSVSGPNSVSYAMLARLGEPGLVGYKTSYTHWADEGRASGKTYATSLLICDEESGQPLAWMDAARVGALRTSAVTALLAQATCTPEPTHALIIGSGTQGQGTIAALADALPSLTDVFVVGTNGDGLRACRRAIEEAGMTAHLRSPDQASSIAPMCQLVIGAAGPHSPVLIEHADLSPGASAIVVGTGVGPSCVAEADVLVATSAEQMQLTGTDLVAPDGSLRAPDLEFPAALRKSTHVRRHDREVICCYNSGLVVTDIALGALMARRLFEQSGDQQRVQMW